MVKAAGLFTTACSKYISRVIGMGQGFKGDGWVIVVSANDFF